MYAGANMGHPSRGMGFVLCSIRNAADGLHLDSVCPLPMQLVTVMISSIHQALHCGRYAVSAITRRAAKEIATPATTTSASAARKPTTPDKDPTTGGPTRNPK
jgi:hypothetical protein